MSEKNIAGSHGREPAAPAAPAGVLELELVHPPTELSGEAPAVELAGEKPIQGSSSGPSSGGAGYWRCSHISINRDPIEMPSTPT